MSFSFLYAPFQSALGWVAGMGMTFPKLDREFNCFGQICDNFYLVFLLVFFNASQIWPIWIGHWHFQRTTGNYQGKN
jgi:hypothetical protein